MTGCWDRSSATLSSATFFLHWATSWETCMCCTESVRMFRCLCQVHLLWGVVREEGARLKYTFATRVAVKPEEHRSFVAFWSADVTMKPTLNLPQRLQNTLVSRYRFTAPLTLCSVAWNHLRSAEAEQLTLVTPEGERRGSDLPQRLDAAASSWETLPLQPHQSRASCVFHPGGCSELRRGRTPPIWPE